MAAAMYGVLFGFGSVLLTTMIPDPIGAVFLWGFVGIQLVLGAQACWRRTGLPLATAAMARGAVMSLCLVVLALIGQPSPQLALASWVWFGGGVVVGSALLWCEARVNTAKWAAWSRHMDQMNVWDMLTGRHIPPLREGGA